MLHQTTTSPQENSRVGTNIFRTSKRRRTITREIFRTSRRTIRREIFRTSSGQAVPAARVDPRNLRVDPRNPRVDPRNLRVHPRNLRVEARNLRVDPRNQRATPRNLTATPRNLRVTPRNPRAAIPRLPSHLVSSGSRKEKVEKRISLFFSMSMKSSITSS